MVGNQYIYLFIADQVVLASILIDERLLQIQEYLFLYLEDDL